MALYQGKPNSDMDQVNKKSFGNSKKESKYHFNKKKPNHVANSTNKHLQKYQD